MHPKSNLTRLLAAALALLPAFDASHGQTQTAPASTQASAKRFMSDEEFLEIGENFDVDACVRTLNPPTIEEIIRSREPIPTLEEVLSVVRHPDKLPSPPVLPKNLVTRVAELDQRIEELFAQSASEDDNQVQDAALNEAIRLAQEVKQLRSDAGQPGSWFEVADAQWQMTTLLHASALSSADRKQLAAASDRAAELSELYWGGKYERAMEIVRSQLAIRRRLLPVAHPAVAMSLNTLAQVCQGRGTLAEAETLHRCALTMVRQLFPGDHPYLAASLTNLAGVLRDRGQLEQAEMLARDGLAMQCRLDARGSSGTAKSLSWLAYVLQDRGQLEQAEVLFREALAIRQRLFSADHPDVANGLNNLAYVLNARGLLEDAEVLYREALAMHRRLYRADHLAVANNLDNLAVVLDERGDSGEAEVLHREALEMLERLFPDGHPRVAACLNNTAAMLVACGRSAEAETRYREALAMQRQLFLGDHSSVAVGLYNLAAVLTEGNRPEEAERLLREALAMLERLFPGDHPRKAACMTNLAAALAAQGLAEDADVRYRDAIAMLERLYPNDNPRTAACMRGLATSLAMHDHPEEAASVYQDSFDISERLRTQILGGERERGAFAEKLSLNDLAADYAKVVARLKRPGEALGILERGRSRVLLDLLEREGRDLVARARKTTEGANAARVDQAVQAETEARIALTTTEALLNGRQRERKQIAERSDLEQPEKEKQLDRYDKEIADLVEDVKRKRQVLTEAGGDVLVALRGLFPVAQPLGTDEIRGQLAADELVLAYSWDSDAVLLLVTPAAGRGDVRSFFLAEGKDKVVALTKHARDVREQLANRPSATTGLGEAAALLADLLPAGARQQIDQAKRLVILPDGPLEGIPFEGLGLETPVVYAASATAYLRAREMAAKRKSTTGALVLGDPVFSRDPQPEPNYPKQGVLVAMVQPESNAAVGGLQRGDVIMSYAGEEVANYDALVAALGKMGKAVEAGERDPNNRDVAVTVWRDDKTVSAKLAPGRLGVQFDRGPAADGLRAMASTSRSLESKAAEISALDQVRLFGGQLPPLPGTRREAQAIAALFGEQATVMTGEVATAPKLRTELTQRMPRYLHLATHGLTGSRDRPYDASLALTVPETPTPDDIGFLTLDELMSRWLGRLKGCDLVVLSACDTGRGIKRGDSVMTLPVGFFAAGVPTVVASLWKVDDTATSLLMTRLYENLLGKRGTAPMTKEAALREAKHWLRSLSLDNVRKRSGMSEEEFQSYAAARGFGEKTTAPRGELQQGAPFAHPYYWAAFILIGDPE